jgi:hypothetical protein
MDILVANKIIVYFRFVDNVLIAYDYKIYRNYKQLIRLTKRRITYSLWGYQKRRTGRDSVSVQGLASCWNVRWSNPGGSEIFRTRPDRPWGPPSLLYNGYRVFFRSGSKAAGALRWPPTPSSAQVKERVQLYLYSPSGPSWPVLGWTKSVEFT